MVVGTSVGVSVLRCELSRCFTADSRSLYVRPRCRAPRRIQLTQLIFGVLATLRCPAAYNSCCINQSSDPWDVLRPHESLFIDVSRRCNGRRSCTLNVDKAAVQLTTEQRISDYVIVGFNCVTNDSSRPRQSWV